MRGDGTAFHGKCERKKPCENERAKMKKRKRKKERVCVCV